MAGGADGIGLEATLRDGPRLYPEQSAALDIALSNRGGAPVEVLSLDLNLRTPRVRALDAAGKPLFEANTATKVTRLAPHLLAGDLPPPRRRTLAPGDSEKTWLGLWSYHDPLPKGHYAVDVEHEAIAGSGEWVAAPRVAFEIADARVTAAALGYESSARQCSILAWVAAPAEGAGESKLLVRLSAAGDHALAQQGATANGAVPPDARIAVSHVAPGGRVTWLGWVLVASGRTLALRAHNMTHPLWQSDALLAPAGSLVPIARFPDRGEHPVPLAVGESAAGPVLVGGSFPMAKLGPGVPLPPLWSVPLAAGAPKLAACAFRESGPVAVFLARESGATTRISRIDVSDDGVVVAAERLVRETGRRLVALAQDVRPEGAPGVVALEAERADRSKLALARLPLEGDPPPEVALEPNAGWPRRGPEEAPALLAERDVALEVGVDGSPFLAFVDEEETLHAGALDGSPLRRVRRGGEGARTRFPHAAALAHAPVAASAFTETGALFRPGGR